jgi:hydroxymethylbilane synthase
MNAMNRRLILGTRPSKMAMVMAEQARDLVAGLGHELEIRTFASQGDKYQGDLKKIGGKGAFVKDLEQRLLSREIDCAIHCLKDVPGDEPMHPDLELLCFLDREDPRDTLIMGTGKPAPKKDDGAGLTLATSSPRRAALLKHLYPAVNVIPLRGNVDTRMRKLMDGEFDGMVLAYAGLQRLKLEQHATYIYEPEEMLPAVGQGVLALQVRKEDAAKCTYLRGINSVETEIIAAAEREMLRSLDGNCYAAIAGYAEKSSNGLKLRGLVASIDGKSVLQADAEGTDAVALGREVAEKLFAQGAKSLIQAEAA